MIPLFLYELVSLSASVFLLFDRNDEIIYRLPAIDQGNLNIAAYLVADAVICIVSLLFCNVGTIDKGDKGGIPGNQGAGQLAAGMHGIPFHQRHFAVF